MAETALQRAMRLKREEEERKRALMNKRPSVGNRPGEREDARQLPVRRASVGNRPGEREDARRPVPVRLPTRATPSRADILRSPSTFQRGNRPGEREDMRQPAPLPPQPQPIIPQWNNRSIGPQPQPQAPRVMYDVGPGDTSPAYGSLFSAQESLTERPDLGWNSYTPLLGTTPASDTSTLLDIKPPMRRTPSERPLGLHPPPTTGPIVSPLGEIRQRTAAAYNYSDDARRALSQTPMDWGTEGVQEGNYYNPESGRLHLDPSRPSTYHLPVVAHELSHKRWFEDLKAQNPGKMQEFLRDTDAMYAAGEPWAVWAVDSWKKFNRENPDFFGFQDAIDDPKRKATELHAGIAGDVRNPNELPDWYREKWYPGVWRDKSLVPEDRSLEPRMRSIPGFGMLPLADNVANGEPYYPEGTQLYNIPGVGQLPLPRTSGQQPTVSLSDRLRPTEATRPTMQQVPGVGMLPLPQDAAQRWSETPAGIRAAGVTENQRQWEDWRRTHGSNTGLDAGLDMLGNVVDNIFMTPQHRLTTTPLPGTDISMGQLGAAAGRAVMQTLNPFNPNRQDFTQGVTPENVFNPITPQIWNIFTGELQRSRNAFAWIEQLPKTERTEAAMAFTNVLSGGDAVRNTASDIINKDDQVRFWTELAIQAQERGDGLLAAQYGREANKLRNTSSVEMAQRHQNVWAEFVGGVVFDPTNIVGPIAGFLGLTPQAFKLMRQGQRVAKFNAMSPEVAAKHVEAAWASARALAESATGGTNSKTWWRFVNPLNWNPRTPDTQAHMSADSLFRQAGVLLNGVSDKTTAQAIITTWIGNPQQLARGTEALTRFGAAALDNTKENLAVLQVAGERLQKLGSLVGEGALNAKEVFGEIDNVLYAAGRRMFGLDNLQDIPVGAARFKVVRGKQGTSVVQYLDNKGKVIGSSAEMVPFDADAYAKQLRNAIQTGGPNALKQAWGVQRAILSDMWLNMRPGHWIRNALSATATLMADDLYTLEPTRNIVSYLTKKTSDAMPTPRIFSAVEGVERGAMQTAVEMTGGLENWTRKFWPKNNPYASLAEWGSNIWSGNTDIAGAVPFGEQNFYIRAFSEGFKRFFEPQWKQAVKEQYAARLLQEGIAEPLAQQLANIATTAGLRGGKGDVMNVIRSAVNNATIPLDLRSLGIEHGAFTPETWDGIDNILRSVVPEQAQGAMASIRAFVKQEGENYLREMADAPPQAGRYVWTELEGVQDGGDIIDAAVETARRAGGNVDAARQQATEFVRQMLDTENGLWATFRREVAANPDTRTFDVIVDAWGQVAQLKRMARAQVDEWSLYAAQQDNPQAWAKKWEETQRIYQELPTQMQKAFDEARSALAGGEFTPRFDFWKVIEDYSAYDEVAVESARTAGVGLTSVNANQQLWGQVIDANRQYIDKSLTELMAVFRRFPSQEALDQVVNAQRQADMMGAQAAGWLARQRDEMLAGRLPATQYQILRNRTWNQFFDNVVLTNNLAKWEIVLDGLATQTDTALRWTDEFVGGEFKLMRPLGETNLDGDDLWVVKKLDDGTIHQFGSRNNSPAPQVPQNVLNDWHRIVGDHEKIVEQTLDDITRNVPQGTGELGEVLIPSRTEPYTVRPVKPEGFNPLGMAGDTPVDGRTVMREANPTTTPGVGDVAYYKADLIQQALRTIESNIDAILRGTPNEMTQAQRMRAIDAAAQLSASWDNILDGATRTGQGLADFSMLNFRDRRNADAWLAMVFPYHYFWTRSARNWAWRVATKPSVANFFYESERAIATENAQADVPVHLEGTLPNPLAQYGIGKDRYANPLHYGLPFAMYGPSPFVDPEDAENDVDKAIRQFQQFTPGIMPAIDLALKYWRGDLDEVELGDYVPLYRIAGYGKQALTGDVSQGWKASGDKWDLGRVGKQIALSVIRGEVDPILAQWAMDVGHQIQNNVGPLEEQPKGAQAAWEAGAQAAGISRFWTTVSGFLFGVPGYDLTPAEQKMRQMKEERFGLRHDPVTNRFGGREQIEALDKQSGGMVSPSFAYSGLYPGNEDRTRPGVSASYNAEQQELEPTYPAEKEEIETLLRKNPAAHEDEVNAIRTKYWEMREEIKAKYPSSDLLEFSGNVPAGMNPKERARWELDRILRTSAADKPEWPGDNADDATMQAYYDELSAFKKQQLDAIETQVTGLLKVPVSTSDRVREADAWRGELQKIAAGKFAQEVLENYERRYMGRFETLWDTRNDYADEVRDAQWAQREAFITQQLGAQAATLFDQYLALPEGEERREFKAKHPLVRTALTAGFNPNEYMEARTLFGNNVWDIYTKSKGEKPEYPGENASDEQFDAYFKKLDAYNAKYPSAYEIELWVEGRSRPFVEGAEGGKYIYDYGKDYEEAKRVFGPDIFTILDNIPDYDANKDAYFDYIEKHNIGAYREWYKEIREGTGETPLGSEIYGPRTREDSRYSFKSDTSRPLNSGRMPILGWEPRTGVPPTADILRQPYDAPTPTPMPTPSNLSATGLSADDYAAMVEDTGYGRGRGYGRRGYGRRGYGGGYGGGGGGGGSYINMPYVESQDMMGGLWAGPTEPWQQWRPENIDYSFLQAGRELRPPGRILNRGWNGSL